MKKILLSIVAIFAMMTISNAQNIGATIGANFANVNSDDFENQNSKFNFTIGLFSEFMLSDKVGLQPELVLSGQGFKYDDIDLSGGGSVPLTVQLKQKFTYVNVPILVNYYVAENFYLQAGPYLGILTNAELNVAGTLGIFGGENKDAFKGTDFGAAIGAGLKVDKFNIGLRYQVGLSNIAEDNAVDIKNRVVHISFGYRFVEQ